MEKLQVEMIYFGPWIERVLFTALSNFGSGPVVRQKVMVDVTRNTTENERDGRRHSPNIRNRWQREEYRKEGNGDISYHPG